VSWLAPAFTIAGKDLRLEMKTRDVVASVGLFVLLVVVMASFAFPTGGEGREGVAAGVLWMAFLFAALLGMGRSMAIEKEDACLEGLLVSPAPREAVFLGKLFTNLGFTFAVELVILPLFMIWLLILATFLGTLGLVTVGTLFAAMAVNTRGREAILPLLVMPVSIPVMVAAVQVSQAGFAGKANSGTTSWLLLMLGYDALFLLVALVTFQYVTEE
jgi:heme exporter protein B